MSFLVVFVIKAQTLSESFDGTQFPPAGWLNTQQSGSGLWTAVAAGVNPTCLPHSGAKLAHFNSYDYAVGVSALLISPPLTFTGSTIHEFSFWKYGDSGWLIYNDSIGVYYNTSTNLTGATHLATIPRYNPIDGWYKHSFVLPANLTGTVYIIFRGYSQYGNNMFIDDVNLVVPPDHDFSAVSIDNPVYLQSMTPTAFSATIKNTGLNSDIANVTCEIRDYSGNLLNTESISGITLQSWTSTTVNFSPFNLPNAEAIYKVRVYTSMVSDMNHENDTIEKTFYTYTHERDFVLLEVGTGTWCTYCPGAAMGADDLVTNGKKVAVVENHNGDIYAYTASDARNSYYSITGYPTAIFDGIKKLTGGDHNNSLYTSYLPIYENRIAIRPAFGLTMAGSAMGNQYTINVLADRYGETPFLNSTLILHLALTQSHIQTNWQGQTHLEFVSRIMAPDANGTTIDLSTTTQVNVPLTFNFNTSWGGSIANHDYELVSWIQDSATKEVLATQKYDLANITVGINDLDNGALITGVMPNPANTETTISIYLKENGMTKIEIYNIQGKLVKTLTDASLSSGMHTYKWDLTNGNGEKMSEGMYLCKVSCGNSTTTRKILVVK